MADPSYSPDLSGAAYRIGDWTLCTRTNRLTRDGVSTDLESRLVHLLVTFVDHRGEVLAKDWLLKTVWAGRTVTDESLMVAISQLRKSLGDDPRAPSYIKTVPGKGYQLVSAAHRVEAVLPPPATPFWRRRATLMVAAGAAVFVVIFAIGRIVPHHNGDIHQADLKTKSDDPAVVLSGIRELRDLAEKTPSADAYTYLARAKIRLLGEDLVQAENCAEVMGLLDKAIALNARQALAYELRAETRFHCRHDAAGAEADYLAALPLSPGKDDVPMGYSNLLLAQERYAESLVQIRAAQKINPLHYSTPWLVWQYQMHGKDDLAWRELKRVEKGGADDRAFHISAMRVYHRAGRDAEVYRHLEWMMRHEGMAQADISAAQAVYRQGGTKAVFGWLLARRETRRLGHYDPPLSWARYALAAGDKEAAMVHLEQAFARHQTPLLWANVDPAYDSVRNDPRFQAGLAGMKAPIN